MDIDVTPWLDEQLETTRRAIVTEQARRATADDQRRAETLLRQAALADLDRTGFAPWVQPTALTAYRPGDTVTHADGRWRSLTDANVWEPGVSGWRQEMPDGTPAPWRQPTGAHDAYPTGALVTHDDHVYRSVVDANVWPPGTPDLWAPVETGQLPSPEPDPEPEPPEPEPEPEPDPEPGPAVWSMGTTYAVGDLVNHQGKTYRCRQAHTALVAGWTPDVVASLWEEVPA